MGSFLTDSISNYTNNKQIPRHGKLNDPNYDRGDFVFLASLTTPASIAETVAAISPADSSFSMKDITLQANAQKQASQDWANKLQDMRNAHQQVKALETDRAVQASLKISAWQRFQQAFTEDNPYSSEDNNLRSEASQRIQALQQAGQSQQQPIQVASLFSSSGGALSSSGKACDDCPEMVMIPAGSFRMGDLNGGGKADEQPVHQVDIQAFAMGKYEVTFAEYDHFAAATNRPMPKDYGWGRGSRPVIDVSWKDAQAYVQWLADKTGLRFRPPTEAEWEYAARAGTTTKYYWGDAVGRNNAHCVGCGSEWDNNTSTAPVGALSANPFGLHDMHGNVWEWLEDCWHTNYKSAPSDGTVWAAGSCSKRVLRGGSWGDVPYEIRSARRAGYKPTGQLSNSGFRVAQDLK